MDDLMNMPPVMILCGGRGTRLGDVAELLPKPMVSIGEQPIIWHIMQTYAAFGVRRFILCLGYKREAFIDYFANFRLRTSDATITLGASPSIVYHPAGIDESGWRVTLASTGLDTMTGGRVLRASRYLEPGDRHFFLTYGDGLADIDIQALYRGHLECGKLLTVAAVRPEARFGSLEIEGDQVVGFEEKPSRSRGCINGGFMAVDRRFIDRYLAGRPDDFFERTPMAQASADGEMTAFRHDGFWQCMDNPREYQLLNELWNSGRAPWTKFWRRG